MKRIDFAIDDESQGIFISALSTLEQLIEGEDLGDLFAENLSFGQELAEDDRGFNVRVILEDSLKKEEKNWLGHVRSIIKIPCGKLLISREFVPEDALEAIQDGEYSQDSAYCLEVPANEYQVDLYSYLPSVNALYILPDDLKIGKWFRESHPDKPFPIWLTSICQSDPKHDPQYKKHWSKWHDKKSREKLSIDTDASAYIDFVLKLQPKRGNVKVSCLQKEGLEERAYTFCHHAGARKLDRCPLGIRSTTLPEWDYHLF